MSEHKYTDEKVIKALYCCNAGICEECPLGKQVCFELPLEVVAADIINRQKAEIAFWMDAAANAKKEAVKEFAERLKKECLFDRGYEILQEGTIDHLVQEFAEEKK